MNFRAQALALSSMVVTCLVMFALAHHHMASLWIHVALDPETRSILSQHLEDQKKLAELDPQHQVEYRQRFDRSRRMLANLEILDANRDEMLTRYERIFIVGLALILISGVAYQLHRQRKVDLRLKNLGQQLGRLAAGEQVCGRVPAGKSIIDRFEGMIHATSQQMSATTQRLKSLENLQAWQESTRRMAHEIKTPLTAARLELARFIEEIIRKAPDLKERCDQAQVSVMQEWSRLNEFTTAFTSFARLGRPVLRPESIHEVLAAFCETYRDAFEHTRLILEPCHDAIVHMDRRMIRQVLVNLVQNAASASSGPTTVTLTPHHTETEARVEVRDDGPGIPQSLRSRLFQPYVTTKPVGEGMGLGLAISKKIMLDHQGDLQLMHSGPKGTTFHLVFPLRNGGEG